MQFVSILFCASGCGVSHVLWYSSTSISQKSSVESRETQQSLRQVRLDVASLHVHRDAESIWGRSTSLFSEASSKLSMVFAFDNELFRSRVYELAHRSAVKYRLRSSQGNPVVIINQRIERELAQGRRQLYREIKCLMVGIPEHRRTLRHTFSQSDSLHSSSVDAQHSVAKSIDNMKRRILLEITDALATWQDNLPIDFDADHKRTVSGFLNHHSRIEDCSMSDIIQITHMWETQTFQHYLAEFGISAEKIKRLFT